jgi:acyl carrier protein
MPADYLSAVRAFIQSNFILTNDVNLRDEDSLLDLQLLDSTGFLELVGFLEDTYKIKVADEEMVPENLESLVNIEQFLKRKLGA